MNAARRTMLLALTAAGLSGALVALSTLPQGAGNVSLATGDLLAGPPVPTPALGADQRAIRTHQRQLQLAQLTVDAATEAAAAATAAAATAAPVRASRSRSVTASPSDPATPQQYARTLLAELGQAGEFGCLTRLWDRESGWSVSSTNPTSGAYGIPQALPARKMASAGADWRTNALTQVRWGVGYIADRYGSPCTALAHSDSVGWY